MHNGASCRINVRCAWPGQYAFVASEPQNELTLLIQGKLSEAAKKIEERTAGQPSNIGYTGMDPSSAATALAIARVQ